MRNDEPDAIDIDDELRKELIEHHKWIVNLAAFVLTISASLAATSDRGVAQTFVPGCILLGLCIIFNWIVIKRLASISIFRATAAERKDLHHQVFVETLRSIRIYENWQHGAFIFGNLILFGSLLGDLM